MTHPKPIPEADHKPLTREECEEAERLCAAATPGPWAVPGGFAPHGQGWQMRHGHLSIDVAETWPSENIVLMGVSRTLLPRALADLRRLRELMERAPTRCHDPIFEDCFGKEPEDVCAACRWDEERKRATEGWTGK